MEKNIQDTMSKNSEHEGDQLTRLIEATPPPPLELALKINLDTTKALSWIESSLKRVNEMLFGTTSFLKPIQQMHSLEGYRLKSFSYGTKVLRSSKIRKANGLTSNDNPTRSTQNLTREKEEIKNQK